MNVPVDDTSRDRPLRFGKILTWLLVAVVIAITAATVRGQSSATAAGDSAVAPVWAESGPSPASGEQAGAGACEAAPAEATNGPSEAQTEAARESQGVAVPADTSASGSPAEAPTEPAAGSSHIVATVNGQPVERAVLVSKLLHYYGERALDSIIQQMLVEQEAERLGLEATPAELDEALEEFYRSGSFGERMPMPERRRRWGELLKARGLTLDDFRDDLRIEILLRKLAERRVEVTDAMVRAKYDELFGERLMLSWIVLAEEAEAREVLRRLASGAEFETLARQVSGDVSSASQGGRLARPVGRGQHGADFEAAVFAMKAGELSAPLRVGQGWAVVRLDERIAGEDIPLKKVEAELRAAVAAEAQAAMRPVVLQELLKKANIVRRPLSPADER